MYNVICTQYPYSKQRIAFALREPLEGFTNIVIKMIAIRTLI